MNRPTTSAFDLPERLAAKADPALIADDEQHFAAMAESLEQSISDLSGRLDAERRAPGGIGQEAMDRDMQIHRLTARLRAASVWTCASDAWSAPQVAAAEPGAAHGLSPGLAAGRSG